TLLRHQGLRGGRLQQGPRAHRGREPVGRRHGRLQGRGGPQDGRVRREHPHEEPPQRGPQRRGEHAERAPGPPRRLRERGAHLGEGGRRQRGVEGEPRPGLARPRAREDVVSLPRRRFLQTTAALGAAAALPLRWASAAGSPKKAVLISMLPKELPFLDRFKMAVDAGFAGVEMQTVGEAKEADAIRDAAGRSGLRIHSVMNSDHWKFPLSSAETEVVDRSVAGMETSLRNARLWGADTVLLVPAVVNPQTSYHEAWTRSQKVVRER